MPLYECECVGCGATGTYVSSVADRDRVPGSCRCGGSLRKVIRSAPGIFCDIAPWDSYESPASGKMITSRRERERDFKETGTRQWEGREQEEKHAARQRQYEAEASERRLEARVEQAFKELPESIKDKCPA